MQNYFIFIPSPYPLPEGEGKRKKPENSIEMTIEFRIKCETRKYFHHIHLLKSILNPQWRIHA